MAVEAVVVREAVVEVAEAMVEEEAGAPADRSTR